MSTWRQRTADVRDRGSLARRDWNPSTDSFHYRLYQYWKTNSPKGDKIARENFCHYWRVVLIWAPLRFIEKHAVAVVLTLFSLIVLGSSTAAIVTGNGLYVVTTVLGLYLVLGLISWGVYLDSQDQDFSVGLTAKQWLLMRCLIAPAMAITAPVVWPIVGLYKLGRYLSRKFDLNRTVVQPAKSFLIWSVTAAPSSSKWLSWIRPILVLPLGLIVAAIWNYWALMVLVGMIGATLFLSLFMAGLYFGDWLHRYFVSVRQEKQHRLRQAVEQGLDDNLDSIMVIPAKQPSKIKLVLLSLLSFLSFLWSIVLVNKWKICPLVELPE